MKEVGLDPGAGSPEQASFAACVATILELDPSVVPALADGEDAPGLDPPLARRPRDRVWCRSPTRRGFSWAGPWIARVSGEGFDGLRVGRHVRRSLGRRLGSRRRDRGRQLGDRGRLRRSRRSTSRWRGRSTGSTAPSPGRVEAITLAPRAGRPIEASSGPRRSPAAGSRATATSSARGRSPRACPGSALTLIEQEVCDSFDPPLSRRRAPPQPDDERRRPERARRPRVHDRLGALPRDAALRAVPDGRQLLRPRRSCARSSIAAACAPTSSRTARSPSATRSTRS